MQRSALRLHPFGGGGRPAPHRGRICRPYHGLCHLLPRQCVFQRSRNQRQNHQSDAACEIWRPSACLST